MNPSFRLRMILAWVLILGGTLSVPGRQVIHGPFPSMVAQLQPLGVLAETNQLRLAIGLPLRNRVSLTNLLREIYDPGSPKYHQYLTPEQFTARFGPTEKDYQDVLAFAKANGLEVVGTHPNRMLVDIRGTVANIEQAMHVRLHLYQHPHEARRFYAPDTDPSLDLAVSVLSISGLDNYRLPQPRMVAQPLTAGERAQPSSGSGPGGNYMGKDFRAAYAPGVNLSGTGQVLGLLQFDGYNANDIAYYESQAGLPSVILSNVLIDGASGNPSGSGGEVEVSLDIEAAISMAPGLSQVMVYMAPNPSPWEDLLNRMANDNVAKQLSCSWYQPGGAAKPTCDQIFQQMAAQGQSFFNASGDYDAYVGLIDFPGDTPYITQVGGTTLTTSGPEGAWVSETVWNRNNGVGSGGGISTQYSIPDWQTSVSMTANQGSTTMRNTPDVALTAENVYVRANGLNYTVGGTSCSAPLWAGFVALVNQQAINNGEATIGFINPKIYAVAQGASYASVFHDTTTGDNTSGSSPNKFFAVTGYDLCTGWGTPAGQSLIDALVGPPVPTPPNITIQPESRTNVSGSLASFSVYAVGSFPLSYQWAMNGTNVPGATNALLTLANVQPADAGSYSVTITNLYGSAISSNAVLTVLTLPPTITLQPSNQTEYIGFSANFNVTATGSLPLSYQWTFNETNILGATNTTLTLTNVQFTQAGNYAVLITNLYGSMLSSNAALTVNPLPPCAPVLSDLVSWWPGEGNANDIVGINNGIASNVTYADGEVGQAFVFNGSSSLIEIPASTSLNVGNSTAGFTLEAWVNPALATVNQLQSLMEWNTGSGSGGAPIGVQLGMSGGFDGNLYANIMDTSLTPHSLNSAPGIMAGNTWQHVAVTFDKASGLTVLYRNGEVVASANLGTGFTPWTSINLYLGCRPAGSFANHFYGYLDEPGLYSRALSALEIQSIYAAGPGGKCPPLLPPSISSQPANQIVAAGDTASFSVTAGGTLPLNYQWIFNGTNIAGATNASLILTNVQAGQDGNYAVWVTNAYGSILSSNAILTVFSPGACVPAPAGLVGWWPGEGNANDAAGTNNGSSAGGLTYSAGEVGQAFIFDGTSAYVVVPASSSDNVGSGNGFTVETWIKPVDLYSHNVENLVEWNDGAGNIGVHFEISVNAYGDLYANIKDSSGGSHIIDTVGGLLAANVFQHVALTYDKISGVAVMYLNGLAITNQTLGSFTPQTSYKLYFGTRPSGPFSPSYFNGAMDELSLYNRALSATEVQAIYNAGSAGKCPLPPTPPVLVLQPTNQVVALGNAVTFAALAEGSPPLNYQWRFGETNISGATNASLTLTNVQFSQAGNYAVLVTNGYGFTLSSNALLTVLAPPSIITPPTSRTNIAGTVATFGVVANGALPLGFQWSKNGSRLADGGNVSGATTTNLSLSNVQDADAAIYTLMATNIVGSVTSSPAALVVVHAPAITTQPAGSTNVVGTVATFSVTASGSLPLSYQWAFGGTNIPGATNTALTLTNVQFSQAGNYAVLVTNRYGTILSSNAMLTVNPPPPCTPAPSGVVSWWPGEASANDVVGTNNGAPSNIAYTNGEVGQAFVFNGSSSQVKIPASPSLNVGTNNTGFTLEGWVNPALATVNQLQSLMEWNTGSGSGGGPIGVQLGMSGGFDANLYANLIDTSLVAHSFNSASGTMIGNTWQHVAVTFDKTSGLAVIYHNGQAVASANLGTGFTPRTGIDFYLGCRPAGNFANHFKGAMDEISLYNRALSSNEIVAIYNAGSSGKCSQPPVILMQPTNQTVAVGSTANFNLTVSGAPPLSFQWRFGGNNILGATNATLVLTNIQAYQAGNYSVLVTNLFGSALSSNAILTVTVNHFGWSSVPSPRFVNTPFAVTIQAQNQTNGLFTNFTGTVLLTSTNGVPVNPTISGNFGQGIWTGSVMIAQPVSNLVLRADDGQGHFGLANPIAVLSPPNLQMLPVGNVALYMWPVGYSGFVLETSDKLWPATWIAVPYAPLQIGDQYVLPLQMTGTNAFYRLQFLGP